MRPSFVSAPGARSSDVCARQARGRSRSGARERRRRRKRDRGRRRRRGVCGGGVRAAQGGMAGGDARECASHCGRAGVRAHTGSSGARAAHVAPRRKGGLALLHALAPRHRRAQPAAAARMGHAPSTHRTQAPSCARACAARRAAARCSCGGRAAAPSSFGRRRMCAAASPRMAPRAPRRQRRRVRASCQLRPSALPRRAPAAWQRRWRACAWQRNGRFCAPPQLPAAAAAPPPPPPRVVRPSGAAGTSSATARVVAGPGHGAAASARVLLALLSAGGLACPAPHQKSVQYRSDVAKPPRAVRRAVQA
jgi:hypothetical protein